MFNDKFTELLVLLIVITLLIVVGILFLSYLAYLDVAFGLPFINGQALLRAMNGQ